MPGREAEAATRLDRIGFDNIAGYLADGMQSLDPQPRLIDRIDDVRRLPRGDVTDSRRKTPRPERVGQADPVPAPPYDTIAEVYQWLVPDTLLTPAGSVSAFWRLLTPLDRGARILDWAAGARQLAAGLAARGLRVVASDASGAMIARTRTLAAEHAVELLPVRCDWEKLPDQGFEPFDAVLCVGNSLAPAPGQRGRQTAHGGNGRGPRRARF